MSNRTKIFSWLSIICCLFFMAQAVSGIMLGYPPDTLAFITIVTCMFSMIAFGVSYLHDTQ